MEKDVLNVKASEGMILGVKHPTGEIKYLKLQEGDTISFNISKHGNANDIKRKVEDIKIL